MSKELNPSIYPGSVTSWHDTSARVLYADLLAVFTAAALPWSTTAVGVLIVLWLLSLVPLIPTLDVRAFLRLMSQPVCFYPIALFALSVIGTLWADIPWQARLHGVSPVAKFLLIPFLFYHFERSQRGCWVFVAFLASCAILMAFSWIVLFAPELKLRTTLGAGVPVKNYIDQSQEFALCMVALAPVVINFYKKHRYGTAAACTGLMLGYFTNMAFVVTARGALIYLPAMLIAFALIHLDRRATALFFTGGIVVVTAVWITSSYMRARVADIATEYRNYKQNIPGSAGLRLEYWQKSIKFFLDAPIFGNGTGSTLRLFEHDAVGKAGLAAEVIGNPHNQTLNIAVQWGLTGLVLLYALWLAHLLLFRGEGLVNWIGLLVVVQNIASSVLNSHLFDFHEGWMYVLGVGVAGGMSLHAKQARRLEC